MWFRPILDSTNATSAGPSHRSKKRRPQRRRATARLRLEGLEDRRLLTFAAPVDYGAGLAAGSVVPADFANNGVQDLAVVSAGGAYYAALSVLPGNGDGTFGAATSIALPNAASLAVGDLTGNGKLDIVTANAGTEYENDQSVSVLLGNGDGTFQTPITFNLPEIGSSFPVPRAVALGNMNHDGKLDAVVLASTLHDEYVEVLLGHGDGTFSVGSTALVGLGAGGTVSLGDFNGDGNLDVAATVSGGVAVLMGNGDGTLGAPATFATSTSGSLAVGDVNGDGKLDLVTAGGDGNGADVSVLLGNGDGTFQAAKTTALPPSPVGSRLQTDGLVMGDLNGDGKLDVAVAGTYYIDSPPYTGGGNVNVLLGNGDGTFTVAQTIPLNNTGGFITAGTFNGDAYPDLAVAHGTVSVLLNEANWSTTPPTATSFAVSGFPSSTQAGTPGTFTVTALNPDGTLDTGYTGTVRFSSSDGQAALPANYTFTAADAGTHTFSATLKTAATQSITATDATTGALTGSETGITVTPAAASHLAVSAPASTTAGGPFSVTVTALDPYDNMAIGYAGTVHFTSSDGQAGLPGNYAFTSGDAGVHTFINAVTLKTAGSQTVTATDMSTSSVSGGASVLVNAAAASAMIVSGFPSPTTAGVAGSFVVTLKDAYGNVATGYTGTVHFTSSDAKAVLPANYTFTSADAGKHTLSATLKTAGTQSITAADTVSAALHGTDSGITVKPAAASKFGLSGPSSVMPGVPFSLTVTVEDAYGNIVTGYVGTVHFSSSDSRAKLPANYTFTSGDDGVHTFTGLVLKKNGNQTITVTDTHNSTVTGKKVVDVV